MIWLVIVKSDFLPFSRLATSKAFLGSGYLSEIISDCYEDWDDSESDEISRAESYSGIYYNEDYLCDYESLELELLLSSKL